MTEELWAEAYLTISGKWGAGWCIYIHHLQEGNDVKAIVKEKWANVALVSALLLSISLPTVFTTPTVSDEVQSDWGAEHLQYFLFIYTFCMALACILLFVSILYVFQLFDALNIHTSCDADVVLFITNYGADMDVPQNLMFYGLTLFYIAFLLGVFLGTSLIVSCSLAAIGCVLFAYLWMRAALIIDKTAKGTLQKRFEEKVSSAGNSKKASHDRKASSSLMQSPRVHADDCALHNDRSSSTEMVSNPMPREQMQQPIQ